MTPEQAHNQKIATPAFQRLVTLIGMEEFRWFLRECVKKKMTELDVLIHDRSKSAADRDDSLSRWTALRDVLEWPVEQANVFGTMLGHTSRISIDIEEPTAKP